MIFRVGQKVVCIHSGVVALDASKYLKTGAIYEVSLVRIDTTGNLVLGLVGVYSHWCASRFRPAVESNTDISIFTKMLNPSLEDMRALIRETAQ
jgi:hypothetical protein